METAVVRRDRSCHGCMLPRGHALPSPSALRRQGSPERRRERGQHLGATPVRSPRLGSRAPHRLFPQRTPGGPNTARLGATAFPTPSRRCPTPGCASSAPPQTHQNTPQQPLPAINPSQPQQPPPPSQAPTHLL